MCVDRCFRHRSLARPPPPPHQCDERHRRNSRLAPQLAARSDGLQLRCSLGLRKDLGVEVVLLCACGAEALHEGGDALAPVALRLEGGEVREQALLDEGDVGVHGVALGLLDDGGVDAEGEGVGEGLAARDVLGYVSLCGRLSMSQLDVFVSGLFLPVCCLALYV